MSVPQAVRASDVVKSYAGTRALDGVSLEVAAGEVVCIVGPNGAGKTTLLEILEGLRKPDSGTVSIFGCDVRHGLRSVRRKVGVAMQRSAFPPLLQVRELLEVHVKLRAAGPSADALLDRLALSHKADARIGRLSGGQLQRLSLAIALAGDPELLILDEPTSELDPLGRHRLWNIIREYRASRQRAIVLTTHQMDEAQALSDRIVVLDRGRVLANDRPDALVARYCPDYTISFSLPSVEYASPLCDLFEQVALEQDAHAVRLRARTRDIGSAFRGLAALREQHPESFQDVQISARTLDDVFVHLTGRALEGT
jgi:ABC-2 type transport system ATP-binding protein